MKGGAAASPFFFGFCSSLLRHYNFLTKESSILTTESASQRLATAGGLEIESLPFAHIPGQSRIFLDHLAASASVAKYFSFLPAASAGRQREADDVCNGFTVDRAKLCSALAEINTNCGASENTFRNIDRLNDRSCVAVLSGQQAGLFTGPLYTIYKALSAVKLAEELTASGVNAVPIFWAATEDHDFEEVAWAEVVGKGEALIRKEFRPAGRIDNSPVGATTIDSSIGAVIGQLADELGNTEFTDAVVEGLSETWKEGRGFGDAFLTQMARIFAPFGLIFADPRHYGLKRLSAPIFSAAIDSAQTIVTRLLDRTAELAADGYHAQVHVEEDHFPIFWLTDKGERSALRLSPDGFVTSKLDRRKFTLAELRTVAEATPERLSAGVMFRPVVQDHLFPTICYFGGAAEIAYFAQCQVVYEQLGRRVTPIRHRQSFTVIESRHQRTLSKYGLSFIDLFAGRDELLPKIVEREVSPDTARLIADVEEKVNAELNRLDRHLAELDVTVADAFAKRRRKMLYHIAAIRTKAYAAAVRNSGDAERRLAAMFDALFPEKVLQERKLNIITYLDRFGEGFIRQLYQAVDLNDNGHRIIYL